MNEPLRKCFFLFLSLNLLFCSLSSEILTKEKVKEVQSLQKMVRDAIREREYSIIKESAKRILSMTDRYYLGEEEYFFLSYQVAFAEKELRNFAEAKRLLSHQLQENPPSEFFLSSNFLFAEILMEEKKIEEAFFLIREVEKRFTQNQWSAENRSFASSISILLNQKYGDLLVKAEQLVESQFFEEAVTLYREVWQAIGDHLYPVIDREKFGKNLREKIRYRFAESLYHLDQSEETLALLQEQEALEESEQLPDVLYLLARAYGKLEKYEQALQPLFHYLELEKSHLLPQYFHVLFELGVNHFSLQREEEGLHYFQRLTEQEKEPHIRNLAHLHQARYFLQKEQYKKVMEMLAPLKEKFYRDGNLRYQWAYLLGESTFQLQNYKRAIDFFRQATPPKNAERVAWYTDVLYNLGWSYLKLSEGKTLPAEEREELINQAEYCFQSIIKQIPHHEKAFLSLARAFLIKRDFSLIDDASIRVETLLSVKNRFSSVDSEAEMYFLRAEAASSPLLKRSFYDELVCKKYEKSPFYSEGWFYKAINEFKLLSEEPPPSLTKDREQLEREALLSFKKAHELLEESHPKEALLSLFYQAQIHAQREERAEQMHALSLLEKLLKDYSEQLSLIEEPYQVFYLQGIVASRLSEENEEDPYVKMTEEAFKRVIAYSPKREFVQRALFGLGKAYFQQEKYRLAEKTFLSLSTEEPDSSVASEAWFWAAESVRKQDRDLKEEQQLFKNVFENYPQSSKAAEAYFSYYRFPDYLQGKKEAIDHLLKMEKLYPDSPFLVFTYYLLGLHYKGDSDSSTNKRDLEMAIDAFDRVKLFFDYAYQNQKIDAEQLFRFATLYYHSFLEIVRLKMQEFSCKENQKKALYLESSVNLLEHLRKQFIDQNHPLVQLFFRKQSYPKIYEEIQYCLGEIYLTLDRQIEAENIFSDMILDYEKREITENYYLAKAWYHRGKLAMRQHHYPIALEYFQQTERAATKNKQLMLAIEEKLELWFEQGECLRLLGQQDESMRVLSQIINDEAGALSETQVRAMYLRAEIYELRGRRDLAKKQLEAIQRQGRWVERAENKLMAEYSFHDADEREVG